MKFVVKKAEEKFNPLSLEIEIETRKEFELLYNLFSSYEKISKLLFDSGKLERKNISEFNRLMSDISIQFLLQSNKK